MSVGDDTTRYGLISEHKASKIAYPFRENDNLRHTMEINIFIKWTTLNSPISRGKLFLCWNIYQNHFIVANSQITRELMIRVNR